MVDQWESVVDGLVDCGMGWWGSLYMAWNVLECHDVVITWRLRGESSAKFGKHGSQRNTIIIITA